MTQAVIYARFSPRPDANECDSVEKQLERCRSYCKAHGYDVISTTSPIVALAFRLSISWRAAASRMAAGASSPIHPMLWRESSSNAPCTLKIFA